MAPQDRSLIMTKEVPPYDLEPFFIPDISQFNIVREICRPKDRFHTHRTRSCANIRERTKIESPAYEDELIGDDKFNAFSKLATDIDEYYQAEIYHERSGTKFRFLPITEIRKMRESLRRKMDVYWIKERMMLDHLDDLKQEVLIEKMKSQVNECNNFLDDYKEENFIHASKLMKEVKKHYQETDRLRKVLEGLEVKVEPLKMKIFLLGNKFIHLTVLQKFQYLMKPTEWRLEHDYIHRTLEGELENNRDSINKRMTANLWNRNNETVYTIKDFIENDYLKHEQEKLCVFENGGAFLKGFQGLRAQSYRSLLQFHLVAHASSDTEKEFINIEDKNRSMINRWSRLARFLSEKRIFMETRLQALETMALKLIDKPLEESVSSEKLHELHGLCEITFKEIVLKSGDSSLAKYYSPAEKIAEVEKTIFRVLGQLDKIPRDKIIEIEKEIRNERKKKLLQAERAYKIEMSVKNRIEQLRRCLTKPPKKEKREGKLPMSVLPKKPSKIKIRKPLLTHIEEEYIRAFTELNADGSIKFDDNAKMMIDRIKNESTPFYLDHLLDTLGFNVAKETEAGAEIILLDEAKDFKFMDVLSSIRSKVKLWEEQNEVRTKWLSRKTFVKLRISMNENLSSCIKKSIARKIDF